MKKASKAFITVIVVVVIVAAGALILLPRLLPDNPLVARFLTSLPFGKPGGQGQNSATAGGRMGPAGKAAGGSAEKFSVPVAVHTASSGPARETLLLYGSVVAQKEVSIFATVPGKVRQVRVQEGDRVGRDQVLADIDRDQAGLKFANVEVTSTIDGIVKSVLTEVGSTASPAAPLFQIVDMDVVELVVNVPEKMIGRLRVGLPVEIAAVPYPNRLFYGAVSRLNPVLDPASRTLEARVRVDNPTHLLKPGMFAEARIVLRQEKQIVRIPLAALLDRDGREVVFLVADASAHLANPTVAFLEGDYAAIESGIKPGDKVVLVGQQNLNDGDEVSVVEERE
jgi:multidrug efflux pump subunit AcrA (membrane-fusion protein)